MATRPRHRRWSLRSEGTDTLSHIRRLVVVATGACCRWTISSVVQAAGCRSGAGVHPGRAGAGAMASLSICSSPSASRPPRPARRASRKCRGKAIVWWWRTTPSRRPSRRKIASRIQALEQRAAQLAGKLDAQEAGQSPARAQALGLRGQGTVLP